MLISSSTLLHTQWYIQGLNGYVAAVRERVPMLTSLQNRVQEFEYGKVANSNMLTHGHLLSSNVQLQLGNSAAAALWYDALCCPM